MKVGLVLIVVIFSFNLHAQSKKGQAGKSGQASLNVTAVVEPSVSFTTNHEGKQELLVSGAKSTQTITGKVAVPKAVVVTLKNRPVSDAVLYVFPDTEKQFDVTHETVMMKVTDAGKTEQRAVVVTTVVAR